MPGAELEELQQRWKYLYHEYLPSLAKAKHDSQKSWPVKLDHCFARIVLDNAVGVDKPWTEVVKSPAIKNMTTTQLQSAISLADKIVQGHVVLVDLDERSLELRGKQSKQGKKRRVADEKQSILQCGLANKKSKKSPSTATVSSYFLPSPTSPGKKTAENNVKQEETTSVKEEARDHVDIPAQLKRIEDSDITAFRKKTLAMLCQIPRGRYSTYGAMADHISQTSHKTCARAVGSAMRNNPFAPEVPCHRILAGDGSLGGFKGHWGEQGRFASHKHELLYKEGVRFDSMGKVKGPPFRDFT
ncbi:hypothetical protein AC579_2319 [Pseudocercospora musae]|uniref:Methylated-DNA--protein-cysteine methyltransferase n=1 Tax=Pseudocercospora musae TaxID=113226 RepID=A0A139I7Q4_9PEZI|nr:hypothetical protein AC579_2319 [Pseudocercospora musae]